MFRNVKKPERITLAFVLKILFAGTLCATLGVFLSKHLPPVKQWDPKKAAQSKNSTLSDVIVNQYKTRIEGTYYYLPPPQKEQDKNKNVASEKKRKVYRVWPLNDGSKIHAPGMGTPVEISEEEFNRKYLSPKDAHDLSDETKEKK